MTDNELVQFYPELILILFGLVVLGYDLVVKGRNAGQEWVTLVGLLAALGASLYALTGQPGPIFSGTFTSDIFTFFFRVVAILTAILILLTSVDYVRQRSSFRGEFYSLLIFSTLAMTLMAGATDLVMVVLSIEFLSITSYVLTGYLRDNPKSNEAAIKYFLYGSITTAGMFFGASLLYGATGSTNLADIAKFFGNRDILLKTNLAGVAVPAMMFLLAGFGFKIALVPFHQWSPDAYEGAPTPVTAFLSVGPKSAGFAMLLRVLLTALPVFQVTWTGVFVGIAILTMTLGNIVAISQSNVKRMLAYSSIAQAGYMLIGVAALSVAGQAINGIGATLVYIFAYLFTNIGAFVAVIALDHLGVGDTVASFAGLIRRSPFMAVALVIFFLSLAGLPPTAGFIGKFFVFAAALQAQLYALAVIGVINGVISIVYYFNIVRQMFFLPALEDTPLRVPSYLQLALVVTLVMTLVIGLAPQPFINLANASAAPFASVIPGGVTALR